MIKIPFLNLREVNSEIESEIIDAVNRVIKSGWYIMGEECKKFESDMSNYLSNDGFVVGCNSGTDALILSLKAADVKPNDEVITVAHTAIPTVSAIVSIGAIPIFVDIDPNTWVMNINLVKDLITDRTKAIIPVHLYGNMVDVFGLKKILSEIGREDIFIIEDCAQAQGSTLKNFQAGTIGNFGAYSFYPSKNIGALGDGGAIFTRNEEHYKKLLMYRNYGQRDRYNAQIVGGLNSRLDEIQAAILDIKLKYINDWNKRKLILMNKYREAFKNLPIKFQSVTDSCIPAWHLCVIELEDKFNRDDVQKKLQSEGLQTIIHYPYPAHIQVAFKKFYRNNLPITEHLAKQIFSLPFSFVLTEETLQSISDVFKKVVRK